jgi:hypothetical protein
MIGVFRMLFFYCQLALVTFHGKIVDINFLSLLLVAIFDGYPMFNNKLQNVALHGCIYLSSDNNGTKFSTFLNRKQHMWFLFKK